MTKTIINGQFRKVYSIFWRLGLLPLIVTGCQSPSVSPPPQQAAIANSQTLKLLSWQAPTILNPHLSTGFKDAEASRITLEPLATFDKNGQ